MTGLFTTPDLGYDLHVAGVNSFDPVDGHAVSGPMDDGRTLMMYQDGHRRVALTGKPDDLRLVLNAWLAQLDENDS